MFSLVYSEKMRVPIASPAKPEISGDEKFRWRS